VPLNLVVGVCVRRIHLAQQNMTVEYNRSRDYT
jgi:hypothetical protein